MGHIPVDYPTKAGAIPKRHSMNCVCKVFFSRCAGQIYGTVTVKVSARHPVADAGWKRAALLATERGPTISTFNF